MKILGTIKSTKVSRQYKRQDGSFAAIYGLTIEAGDDVIIAESFITKEGQQKRGIVPGAIGTAILEFGLHEWTDNSGTQRTTQTIRLKDFVIANRNIFTDVAQSVAAEEQPTESAATVEQVMTQVGQDAEPATVEGGKLPF